MHHRGMYSNYKKFGIHPNNYVQMLVEVVPQFWLHERENGKHFFISTNSRTIAISTSLKNSGKECSKMREASKMCKHQIKGLTWNGTSTLVAALDFMVILNRLDYISKALVNIMNGEILATCKDIAFAFKILIGFKHCLE